MAMSLEDPYLCLCLIFTSVENTGPRERLVCTAPRAGVTTAEWDLEGNVSAPAQGLIYKGAAWLS
jgi:hypothetical protein